MAIGYIIVQRSARVLRLRVHQEVKESRQPGAVLLLDAALHGVLIMTVTRYRW